jgi:hypothetical protein
LFAHTRVGVAADRDWFELSSGAALGPIRALPLT